MYKRQVQALIGDKVDNIPGVPGVGVKTASSLISEFQTVENLVKKYEAIDKDRIRNLISDNIDKIILSKKLVTLLKTVEIDTNLQDLELATLNLDKLLVFTKLMELNTLSRRISADILLDNVFSSISFVKTSNLSRFRVASSRS